MSDLIYLSPGQFSWEEGDSCPWGRDNYKDEKSSERKLFSGAIVQGAIIFRAIVHRPIVLQGKFSSAVIILGANYPEGNHPGDNYSEANVQGQFSSVAIVWWTKFRRAIIQEAIVFGGNYPDTFRVMSNVLYFLNKILFGHFKA